MSWLVEHEIRDVSCGLYKVGQVKFREDCSADRHGSDSLTTGPVAPSAALSLPVSGGARWRCTATLGEVTLAAAFTIGPL